MIGITDNINLSNWHRQTKYLVAVAAFVALLVLAATGCRDRGAQPQSESSGSEKDSGSKLIKFEGSAGVEMGAEGIQLAGISTVTAGVQDLAKSLQPTGEVAAT